MGTSHAHHVDLGIHLVGKTLSAEQPCASSTRRALEPRNPVAQRARAVATTECHSADEMATDRKGARLDADGCSILSVRSGLAAKGSVIESEHAIHAIGHPSARCTGGTAGEYVGRPLSASTNANKSSARRAFFTTSSNGPHNLRQTGVLEVRSAAALPPRSTEIDRPPAQPLDGTRHAANIPLPTSDAAITGSGSAVTAATPCATQSPPSAAVHPPAASDDEERKFTNQNNPNSTRPPLRAAGSASNDEPLLQRVVVVKMPGRPLDLPASPTER
jgi:hypothetical protein